MLNKLGMVSQPLSIWLSITAASFREAEEAIIGHSMKQCGFAWHGAMALDHSPHHICKMQQTKHMDEDTLWLNAKCGSYKSVDFTYVKHTFVLPSTSTCMPLHVYMER